MSRENNTPSKKIVKPLTADQIKELNKAGPHIRRLDKAGAHFVLADDTKRPIQKDWINTPPTKAALSAHFKAGGLLGLIPASIGCCVIDIDDTKDAKLLNELATTAAAWHKTRREGGYHYWFRCAEAPEGNQALHWKGKKVGDYRHAKGFIVLWKPKAVAPLIEMEAGDSLPQIVKQLLAGGKTAKSAKTGKTADWSEGARNDTLNSLAFAAGQEFGKAKTDEAKKAARDKLAQAKKKAEVAGLDASEIGATAASGWNGGVSAAATGNKKSKAQAAGNALEGLAVPKEYDAPELVYRTDKEGMRALEYRAPDTVARAAACLGYCPRYDEWTQTYHTDKPTYRGGLFNTLISGDDYTINMRAALIRRWPQFVKASKELVGDSWRMLAKSNAYNSWCDWSDGLPSDVPKEYDAAEWLADVWGLDGDATTLALLRVFLLGAWHRANNPGCDHDYMLVLQGKPGRGKSKAVKWLAVMPEWWSSSVPLTDTDPTKLIYAIRGRWIMEYGEMERLYKREQGTVKHNISNPIDKARLKYERTETTYKRQGVFIGTAEDKDYLSDPSNTRRYHIVNVVRPMRWEAMTADSVRTLWAKVKRDYGSGARASDYLTGGVAAAAHDRATEATAELLFIDDLTELFTTGKLHNRLDPDARPMWGTMQTPERIYRGLFPDGYADHRAEGRKHARAVSVALRALGCERKRAKGGNIWLIPAKPDDTDE